jgi:hypothetical protein
MSFAELNEANGPWVGVTPLINWPLHQSAVPPRSTFPRAHSNILLAGDCAGLDCAIKGLPSKPC